VTGRRPGRWPDKGQTLAGRAAFRTALRFAVEARACGLDAKISRSDADLVGWYAVQVTVEHVAIGRRHVRIMFPPRAGDPRVRADGPTASPHRYRGGFLCMWHPADPDEQRWIPGHGAAALLTRIVAHLMREEWWRRTGEWVGDEAPHDLPAPEGSRAERRAAGRRGPLHPIRAAATPAPAGSPVTLEREDQVVVRLDTVIDLRDAATVDAADHVS
jgi:hypothetical protein